ncbi:hypothetical protein GGI42DRAFT_325167 [Trichoderma sp. SZMC 28013]
MLSFSASAALLSSCYVWTKLAVQRLSALVHTFNLTKKMNRRKLACLTRLSQTLLLHTYCPHVPDDRDRQVIPRVPRPRYPASLKSPPGPSTTIPCHAMRITQCK